MRQSQIWCVQKSKWARVMSELYVLLTPCIILYKWKIQFEYVLRYFLLCHHFLWSASLSPSTMCQCIYHSESYLAQLLQISFMKIRCIIQNYVEYKKMNMFYTWIKFSCLPNGKYKEFAWCIIITIVYIIETMEIKYILAMFRFDNAMFYWSYINIYLLDVLRLTTWGFWCKRIYL